ncbi:MAG: hypothetical protein AAGN46_13320 [Acidobacteriota bacterium]
MFLEKFNRVLWAVVGTLLLGLLLLVTYWIVEEWLGSPSSFGQREIVVGTDARPAAEEAVPEPFYCLPQLVPNSSIQLIGVAVLDGSASDAERRFLSSGSGKSSDSSSNVCRLTRRSGLSARIRNVIARDAETGDQRLVFDRPVLIERLELPDKDCDAIPQEDCGRRSGLAPCDAIYWEIRDRDSNDDGVIDAADARVAYLSDLDGQRLRRLSPEGRHIEGAVREPGTDAFLLQVQDDSDGDGRFGAGDRSTLLRVDESGSVALVDPEIESAARRILR